MVQFTAYTIAWKTPTPPPLPRSAEPPLYHVVPGWEQLHPVMRHGELAGVAIDSRDCLFALTRQEPRC